jgi:RND family efflux transporter MFP subunit
MKIRHYKKGFAGVMLALSAACLWPGGRTWAEASSAYDYQNEIKVVLIAPVPVLSSVVSAPVREIHCRFGESFAKGDPLVTLDDALYVANLEAAEAAFNAERVKCEALKNLYEEGNASLVDRERAVGLMMEAQRNLVNAREKMLGCRICAPFDGRVGELLVDEHEWVELGRPLIRLVNDSSLLAQFLLDEEWFDQVKPGIKVKISVTATRQEIEGTIKYIAAEVDPASGTFEVRAEVDNASGRLRTGMNASLDRAALIKSLR